VSNPHCQQNKKTGAGFSLKEKILMGMGLYGSILIAACGIFLHSITWGLLYLGFVSFGMLVLFGYGLCSHCPYIYEEYSDCLFPPWGKVYRKLYKYRSSKLTSFDKIAFFITMIGIPVIPQYWLFKNHTVLVIFFLFYISTAAGFICYECRRCRHLGCPFNMVKKEAGNFRE